VRKLECRKHFLIPSARFLSRKWREFNYSLFFSKNGSVAFDPLPLLVALDPTVAAAMVGGISPVGNTWWENQTTTAAATDYTHFLNEVLHLYNNCSKGPGGPRRLQFVTNRPGNFSLLLIITSIVLKHLKLEIIHFQ